MPRQSVPHMHKALSCVLLKRFISVTKDMKQRDRINACCVDEVLHFKGGGDKKKKKYTVVFAVCCLLLYKMLPGSIFVLPTDSPLFSLAFVRQKRRYQFTLSLTAPCRVMFKRKELCVRSASGKILFIACHMYKLK